MLGQVVANRLWLHNLERGGVVVEEEGEMDRSAGIE
jgi:hypothetical protein